MNDQRIELPSGRQVHVVEFVTGDWQVWLNTKQDFEGLRIGQGRTRADAIASAKAALEETMQSFEE